jgi:hypothetical protein
MLLVVVLWQQLWSLSSRSHVPASRQTTVYWCRKGGLDRYDAHGDWCHLGLDRGLAIHR